MTDNPFHDSDLPADAFSQTESRGIAAGTENALVASCESLRTFGRRRLPNRRAHDLIAFEHNGQRYVGGVGRFQDGTLAEVFLNSEKHGTALETIARDAAIT